jgi:hypothetical protein
MDGELSGRRRKKEWRERTNIIAAYTDKYSSNDIYS